MKIITRILAVLLLVASSAWAADSWPKAPYTEVRAYSYNRSGKKEVFDRAGQRLMYEPLFDDDGKPGPSVLNKSGARLTPEQTRRLIGAITGDHPAHIFARCFNPHHAFVFYDAHGKHVAFLEVCFECSQIRGWPETPKGKWEDMDALLQLCKELKLPHTP